MTDTTNSADVVNQAELAHLLGTTTKTLRKVIRGNPDFPVLARGVSGRAYRFDKARAVAWWRDKEARREAEAEARRNMLRRCPIDWR
jgi:phage terminase Nu1 subunit (DNA packaging protein)